MEASPEEAKRNQLRNLQNMTLSHSQAPIPPGFGPSFLRALASPDCRKVLIAGCGGGFDFVHSALLMPMLRGLQKEVFFLSYSFGSVKNLPDAKVVFAATDSTDPSAEEQIMRKTSPVVKIVNGASSGPPNYQPEIRYCSFLDKKFAESAPHSMYACYARDFVPNHLFDVYKMIIEKHDIDTLLLIDGGTDSLMRGDESGLGDPIEDATSVCAAARLRTLRHKFLISIGFGADRFNGVSDGASLRAVAELTKMGGFRGSFSIELEDPGRLFYEELLEHIYQAQSFRSVLSSLILASSKGDYGVIVPALSGGRVQEGDGAYVWPLMTMLFCFDVDVVFERSLICKWINAAESPTHAHFLLMQGRHTVEIRPEEQIGK